MTIGSATGAGASIGFRCKRLTSSGTYINGFMTAGHSNAAGNSIFYSGVYVGYVQAYVYGGYVDGAFVHVNNTSYSMTNITQHGGFVLNSGAYVSNFVEGLSVYKDGFVTGMTVGKILSTSVTSSSSDGVTLTDCVRADYRSNNGDSGGVIFINYNSSYPIAGIHRSASSNYAVFVKATRIREFLDVILY